MQICKNLQFDYVGSMVSYRTLEKSLFANFGRGVGQQFFPGVTVLNEPGDQI